MTKIRKLLSILLFIILSATLSAQTLSLDKVTVKMAITEIEKTMGYSFVFSTNALKTDAVVSINAQTVEEAIKQLLANQDVTWELEGKTIVIKSAKGQDSAPSQTKQPKHTPFVVSGTVVDESGMPVIGAGVLLSGTKNGKVTDMDGRFSMTMQAPGSLTISFIGYSNQVVEFSGESDLTIILKEDKQILEEVVVVGFATQKKENLTGSVAQISSKALTDVPVTNVSQALQGQVPGLNITRGSGFLNGKGESIDVRGLATIGAGSSGGVLVLIDGMEGDLNSVNSQDVESISVLKDAAASSIYGSRAPFGVILVTTKKGGKGHASIGYSGNFRVNTPINLPHQADSFSWAMYMNDGAANSGQGAIVSDENIQRIRDYIDGRINYNTVPAEDGKSWSGPYSGRRSNANEDYYNIIFKKLTFAHDHNINVSGGNDRINYFVSANYLDEQGLVNWDLDGLKRLNVYGRVEAKVYDRLTVGFSSRLVRSDYHQPIFLSDTDEEENMFLNLGKWCWQIFPAYDPNGNLFNDTLLRLKNGGQKKEIDTQSTSQLNLTWEPLPHWRIVGSANYRVGNSVSTSVTIPVTQTLMDGISPSPSGHWNDMSKVAESTSRHDYITSNIYTDYENTFGGHYFKAMVGFQMEDYLSQYDYICKAGIVDYNNPTIDNCTGVYRKPFNDTAEPQVVGPWVYGSKARWRTVGFFGRLNYNYKEKYLAEVNLRYDGSSRFRQRNRWGLFPSFSLGWNIAKEQFFAPASPYISTLKLRASYGSLGNQNTNSYYPTYQTMGYNTMNGTWLIHGQKTNTAWAPSLISSVLTWENVISYNVGFDIGAFKNRLTASFDWFLRDTKNMVGPADELPVVLGTSVPKTNNTDLRTRGFDLEIMWKDVVGDFSYSIRGVLSDSRSFITKYSNPSNSIDTYYAGMEWGSIWGYTTVGLAQTDEQMNNHLATTNQTYFAPNGWRAGDIMYKDITGDGKVDPGKRTVEDHGDLSIIGNTTPRYNFGLDFTFMWKGIDFRMFLQGVGKREFYNTSWYFAGSYGSNMWNTVVLKEHMDYFRDDPNHPLGTNLDAYYPRVRFDDKNGNRCGRNYHSQTRYLQNAAYMRLKNLQLGYTIPEKFTTKAKISKLRFYFSGENLFTLTSMTKLFDPETIGTNGGSTYPLSRTYSFGVNVTF